MSRRSHGVFFYKHVIVNSQKGKFVEKIFLVEPGQCYTDLNLYTLQDICKSALTCLKSEQKEKI